MAGIGFELKNLFRKKGVLALFRAYGYAGIICTGPMLLGVILLLGVMLLAQMYGAAKLDRDLLVCMVTYALLASLTLTSLFSMVTTRFIADMLYEEKTKAVMPSFYGCCSIMLAVGSIGYGIFLHFSGIPFGMQILNLLLFGELIVVWTQMNYLTAIKDYKGILIAFAVSLGAAFLTALLLLTLHVEVKTALLLALCTGYGMLMCWYMVLLLQYFPEGEGSSFSFLRWFDLYLPLALTGFFLNLGLFSHLVLAWFSPIGEQVLGLFYGAPSHDVPALFAFLTILITTVNFVTSVEVNFYPRYRDYYGQFNGKGSIKDIMQSEEEMLTTLSHELLNTARKQLYTTALAISVGVLVIARLPLGFSDVMNMYFRILCVAYGMYSVGNTVLLILLYFTDYKGAVWAAVAFGVISTAASAALAFWNTSYIGFGFMAASAIFFLVTVVRLEFFTKKLSYHILSTQPVVVQRTKGIFHTLCSWLEQKGVGER
ncbi:MAG: exopolysaccharide Pel transporter PelG [Lachnospiraceae bacterium]|nr:exopolysaccharide Pel transporter PelG [Lachnospiraceae bacterium]